jgi:hypothetical protein
MADFDILGKLVHSKNIDREEFLEVYGSLAYRCWRCLEDHVTAERDQRNFPPFMTWFQWLGTEGYNYWKYQELRGYDLDGTDLFHPDNPERKISFKCKPKKKKIGSPI